MTQVILANTPQVLAQRFSSASVVRKRIVTSSGNQILAGVLLNQVG